MDSTKYGLHSISSAPSERGWAGRHTELQRLLQEWMSALVLTDSMESITGSFQALVPGRKQSTSQNPCSEKDTGKGTSSPYAQQCFKLYPTLFKVRKGAEGPVLLAVFWATLS